MLKIDTAYAQRHLPMDGAPNFRDFGGYPTADGGQVKWGFLFRSGQLSQLSEADVELLSSLGLDLVCDFRRLDEQENDPSRLPQRNAPHIVPLPITPGSNAGFFEQSEIELGGRQVMYDFMVDINRDFVEQQTATYARMFTEILARDDARFLVHCAAGKDRTGFAAAIILMALGVAEDVVMQDYMLTAEFYSPEKEVARLQAKYQMEGMDTDSVMPMLEVHPEYLAKALDSIKQHYRSTPVYLEEALGVGPAQLAELRRRYLVQ